MYMIDQLSAAQRIRSFERSTVSLIHWDVVAVWLLALCLCAAFWGWTYGALADLRQNDYTDTGVGCVDDCLEPTAAPHPTPLPMMEA